VTVACLPDISSTHPAREPGPGSTLSTASK